MHHQAQELSQALNKAMRRFGRQCRGQGKIFVKLVRETERHLLELGDSIESWTQQARACLHQDSTRSHTQRERLRRDLEATRAAHRHITKQSQRLTQGKKLAHCKIVNASDPTIAPILKGKSNCPAQFGRKTGIMNVCSSTVMKPVAVVNAYPVLQGPMVRKAQSYALTPSGPTRRVERWEAWVTPGDLGTIRGG